MWFQAIERKAMSFLSLVFIFLCHLVNMAKDLEYFLFKTHSTLKNGALLKKTKTNKPPPKQVELVSMVEKYW